MSPKVSEQYTNSKIELILRAAASVFIKKGYFDTTMQDIVNECNISRGGLYRYFSSTEEIFKEILERDIIENEDTFKCPLRNEEDYFELLAGLTREAGEVLLNVQDTIIPATYEYFIKNIRNGQVSDCLTKRHESALKMVMQIIQYGIDRGQITEEIDVEAVSNCILAYIEGLNITATASAVDPDMLCRQIEAFLLMLKMYLKRG